jgi:hypothetical protein
MKIVDGLSLPKPQRDCLRPGDLLQDGCGETHRLPRFFYEVPSWDEAKQFKLTVNFTLAELILVDCRESRALFRHPPLYVPCAVTVLGRYLQEFRNRVEAPGLRQREWRLPIARASMGSQPARWSRQRSSLGGGRRIFIGSVTPGSMRRSPIERHARIAQGIGPEVFVRSFGCGAGETDDHLHLDLGFVTLMPHGSERSINAPYGLREALHPAVVRLPKRCRRVRASGWRRSSPFTSMGRNAGRRQSSVTRAI